jgi:dTDP-4-dehydrorhamnose reductase
VPKVLVTGARGQLAADLGRVLAHREVVALDRTALDIGEPAAVAACLRELRPRLVLNAAAYNAVDAAEDEPERALRTNTLGPLYVARACREVGALLVHFSTDYVFDGTSRRPYREDDPPRPLSVYAASKLAGEELVRISGADHLIVRTCGLFGKQGRERGGGNFVERMLAAALSGRKLRVVRDQIVAPTSTADLAAKVVELLARVEPDRPREMLGVWHVTNSGECSWYEFARAIFEEAGVAADLSPVTAAEFGARARRPPFSVLASERLRAAGLRPLRHWREALRDYLADHPNRRTGT